MSHDEVLAAMKKAWMNARYDGKQLTLSELLVGQFAWVMDDRALKEKVEKSVAQWSAEFPESMAPSSTSDQNKPAPAKSLPPVIPGYELLDERREGGMGVVYKARHVRLDRIVALKMIKQGGVERFRTEARAAANLNHQNVVPIYDFGEIDNIPFYSMMWIESGNLAQSIARDEWSPNDLGNQHRAAILMEAVALAVQHAHEAGVVHRDLKPSNILLDKNGYPHVADFGLAVPVSAATGEHRAVGTPDYRAPEHATPSNKPTAVTDVYSLGAIFYDLLHGKRHHVPNGGPTERVLPNLPSINKDLKAICDKALRLDPKERYQSAKAFADDLRNWLNDRPVEARPVGRYVRISKWCKRNRVATGLIVSIATGFILVSAALALAVSQWNRAEAKHQEANVQKGIAETNAEIAKTNEGVANAERKEANLQRAKADANAQIAKTNEEVAKTERKKAEDRANELQIQRSKNRKSLATAIDLVGIVTQLDREAMRVPHADDPKRLEMVKKTRDSCELLLANAEDPTELDVRFQLFVIRRVLGNTCVALGDTEGARASYGAAIDMYRDLRPEPKTREWRREYASLTNNAGLLFLDLGRYKDSEEMFEVSELTFGQLAAEDPNEPDFLVMQATVFANWSTTLQKSGKIENLAKAEDHVRRACELFDRVTKQHKKRSDYKARFAMALANHAELLQTRQKTRPEDIDPIYSQSITLFRDLLKESPWQVEYRVGLAGALNNQGTLLREMKEYTNAKDRLGESLIILVRLNEEFPKRIEFLSQLSEVSNNQGFLFRRMGEPDLAEKSYRSALALRQKLVAYAPDVAESHHLLGGTINNLSVLLFDRPKLPEVELREMLRLLELGRTHHEKAVELSDGNPRYRLGYNNCQKLMAKTLYRLGDKEAAQKILESIK